MSFILKRYKVTVPNYGADHFFAKNTGQARARAFRALQRANDQITFKRFLQMKPKIKRVDDPAVFGNRILVDGKPAYWVERAGGNSIRFCWPNSDKIMISHELDVSFPAKEQEA